MLVLFPVDLFVLEEVVENHDFQSHKSSKRRRPRKYFQMTSSRQLERMPKYDRVSFVVVARRSMSTGPQTWFCFSDPQKLCFALRFQKA